MNKNKDEIYVNQRNYKLSLLVQKRLNVKSQDSYSHVIDWHCQWGGKTSRLTRGKARRHWLRFVHSTQLSRTILGCAATSRLELPSGGGCWASRAVSRSPLASPCTGKAYLCTALSLSIWFLLLSLPFFGSTEGLLWRPRVKSSPTTWQSVIFQS